MTIAESTVAKQDSALNDQKQPVAAAADHDSTTAIAATADKSITTFAKHESPPVKPDTDPVAATDLSKVNN